MLIWVVDSTQNTHTFAKCTHPPFPICLPPFPISVLTFSPLPAAEALFDVFQSEDLPYGVPLVVIATRQVLIHHHNVVVVVPSLGT